MTVADKVENAEILYRRVPNQQPEFYSVADGGLQLSASAFNDPAKQPSVDRARKCNSNPAHTKKNLTDGVVSLDALSVRQIADIIQKDDHGQPKLTYKIDIIPDPIKDHPSLPDNPAHALIVSCPDFAEDKKSWKKLKECLALLAFRGGWLIEPA